MTQKRPELPSLSPEDLFDLFRQKEGLIAGHFQLSSGLHSGMYLQCAKVLQHPEVAERIGSAIAQNFSDMKPDCVVGPAIGGIVIAQEVARALGVRAMFTERVSGSMTLRRGFTLEEGERVLVAEDITTTGGSVQEVINAVGEMGATVIGVGVIIDRSGGKARFDVPFKPLAVMEVKTFSEDECPFCQSGTPIDKPGSRKS